MYRRSPYRRGGKYSNETTLVNLELSGTAQPHVSFPFDSQTNKYGMDIINPTIVLGNRKVKNFTLKFTAVNFSGPIIGCLVYVPEGTDVNGLNMANAANKMYEPNQNVICNFVIPASDSSNSTVTVSSRLARNLNSNDRICLICGLPVGNDPGQAGKSYLMGTVNFSIKY